ncbi:MAG: FMN-binding negative transcriptional regulator [Chitinophagaceae bacterium]|nr:FMN-binding negative transcriptional regulator [Chitinophagaceae bacterium]
MYNLPHYKEKDQAAVLAFMKTHPFITVIGVDANNFPVATQVPVLIREEGQEIHLRGHIMRSNDHHLAFEANPSVLALFTSPHTYVSASWYSNQQQGSTWNYMTVQAHGTMSLLQEKELLEVLQDLTARFENPASPSSFQHIPQDYLDRMTKAIVAFDIKVTRIEHVFKLSQNRDRQSFDTIVEKLAAGDAGAQYIAAEMKKCKEQLYPA